MEIGLTLLSSIVILLSIVILYVLRGRSLKQRESTGIRIINSFLNDALSWVLLKSGPNSKALFIPAWIDALNEHSDTR